MNSPNAPLLAIPATVALPDLVTALNDRLRRINTAFAVIPVITADPSGAAVATTAATNSSPFGYTTAAQANEIIALLNKIRTALIDNGLMAA